MRPDKIKTHKDVSKHDLDHFAASARRRFGRTGRVSKELAAGPVVVARINHGRWIGDCPFCPGAEMIDPGDPRFFCVSCDNEAAGGKWLPVKLPSRGHMQNIEAELLKRPEPKNRNWQPGESLKQLRAENKANGVSE